MIERLFASADRSRSSLESLRRDLHRNPELAFKEVRTGSIVAERLSAAGLRIQRGVATTGVVGVLAGGRPGPTVLVRADIDGLPIQEATGAAYASTNQGVMHACGHDGHTAIAVAVAELIAAERAEMPGTLVFAFQPAEEIASGAQPMIDAGVMANPSADAVVGLHLWNDLPVGTVALRPGPAFASMDEIIIHVEGKGGHGAIPHKAADPIVAAAHIVTALQTIVSRETSPFDSAVVTIGTIHAGTAFNIIPNAVEMRGTVRTFSDDVRDRTLRRIDQIAVGTAAALGTTATLEVRFGCPVVVNDAAVTDTVRAVAVRVVGEASVVEMTPTMGSDDVAYFLRRAPGCYFLVGSSNRARGLDGPHHHPSFDFDEDALVIGVKVLGGAALQILQRRDR